MKSWLLPLAAALVACNGPTPAQRPAISGFAASPQAVKSGESSTLAWSATAKAALQLDPGNVDVTNEQQHVVTPAATTTYTLTATNEGGSVSATVQVTVLPAPVAPVINTFTATPGSITSGASTTLAWSVTGAESLTIDQGVGTVAGTSRTVSPAATTTYRLTATNAVGSVTATTTVTVIVPPPVISSFTANPITITAGQSTTLSWTVAGATTLTLAPGVGTVTGSGRAVSPGSTTTYTLTANNSAGPASAQTTVTVSPALWVSAYYAGYFWDTHTDDPVAALAEVDVSQLTHLLFARYAPGAGADAGKLLEAAGTAHTEIEDPLIAKVHAAGKKAILMIGGAGDGPAFVASTTSSTRATFIDAVLDRTVAKGYDGVDVDWEDSLDTTAKRTQLVSFLTELRAAAAQRPAYQASPFLITFPGSWANINTDLPLPAWCKQVADAVDQYNLMSYDMLWDADGWQTWLWAAIKGAGATHPTSLESSIQAYVDLGIPRSKLGLGLGLYGGGYTAPVTGPRQTVSTFWGGDDSDGVTNTFADLYAKGMFSSGTYTFDTAGQAGYYTYSPARSYAGNAVSMLVTEDLQSIAAKGAWAKAGNCGGAIVWTMNYGYIPGSGNVAMAAIKSAFLQ